MAKSWGCRAGRVWPCFMVWLGRSVMVLTVLRQTTAAGSWRRSKDALRYEELKAGLRAYAEGLDGGRAEMVVESDALGGEA